MDTMDEVGSDHDDVLNSENEIEQRFVFQHIGDEEYLSSNDNYLDDMIANDLSASDNIIDNETLPNKNNLTNIVDHCTIEIIHNNRQTKCNKIIVTGYGSTGNFWDHLGAIHGITKDNNTKFTKSNQQNIKYTFQNPIQQKLQNQTSYSRDGYLGVICYWINNEFKLNKIVLGIYQCKYPHTGETIKDMLNNIMNK
ncbi:13005_t:CDS:2 [Cetraspora pellucida]|uniref:13005_t:CDS:1 n=1 Tax=Cetraspora pellucida TaxID=1433469 RepID=A0A9N9PDP7_9GLOM|nr:13005_t:CDS:2 [Cetraspora pellucida]